MLFVHLFSFRFLSYLSFYFSLHCFIFCCCYFVMLLYCLAVYFFCYFLFVSVCVFSVPSRSWQLPHYLSFFCYGSFLPSSFLFPHCVFPIIFRYCFLVRSLLFLLCIICYTRFASFMLLYFRSFMFFSVMSSSFLFRRVPYLFYVPLVCFSFISSCIYFFSCHVYFLFRFRHVVSCMLCGSLLFYFVVCSVSFLFCSLISCQFVKVSLRSVMLLCVSGLLGSSSVIECIFILLYYCIFSSATSLSFMLFSLRFVFSCMYFQLCACSFFVSFLLHYGTFFSFCFAFRLVL